MGNRAAQDDDRGVQDVLDAGLSRLRAPQRQVILLRYLEGLSTEEAAAQLGLSAAAVAKRSERGLEKLREFFAGRGYAAWALGLVLAVTGERPEEALSVLHGCLEARNPYVVGLASSGRRAVDAADRGEWKHPWPKHENR